MANPTNNCEDLLQNLKKANQEHLLSFYNDISQSEQSNLLTQIKELKLAQLNSDFKKATNCAKNSLPNLQALAENEWNGVSRSSPQELEEYKNIGLQAISQGEVAVALLAGGQGTRLGVDYPKGMFNVDLPSQKSLFQLHSERILRLEHLVFELCGKKVAIPWYIMTSEFTNGLTNSFFEQNGFFGLLKTQINIFEQSLLPAFDFSGRILLQNKSNLSQSPNGNGDFFAALQKNGLLEKMSNTGIKYLHVFCVDNILAKVGDPIFLGYLISKNAECGVKVIERLEPQESLGCVCRLENGSYSIVEYSEISNEDRLRRNLDGSLYFRAGNICMHIFSVDFVRRILEEPGCELPYHVARKKILCVGADGVVVIPGVANGIKLEKFIFDCVPFARKLAVWEASREEEFSPLKNSSADPSANPLTAKKSFLDLSKKYFLKQNSHFGSLPILEVSPLVSYWDEGLTGLSECDLSSDVVYITTDVAGGNVVAKHLAK